MATEDPHGEASVATAGASPEAASTAVLALHGRGAAAQGMLDLAREVGADDVAIRAPQASKRTWYPQSFLAPVEENEPWLSSALGLVGRVLDDLAAQGIPRERTLVLGFSQGACLAAEYVARNAGRYGGLAVLSGGLIGPDGTPRDYAGSLEGTPAFLGCGDRDPHIPVERVEVTASVFRALEADVDDRIYEGMAHDVVEDELEAVRAMVRRLAGEPDGE